MLLTPSTLQNLTNQGYSYYVYIHDISKGRLLISEIMTLFPFKTEAEAQIFLLNNKTGDKDYIIDSWEQLEELASGVDGLKVEIHLPCAEDT